MEKINLDDFFGRKRRVNEKYIGFKHVNVDNLYKECYAEVVTLKNGDIVKKKRVSYNNLSLTEKVSAKRSRIFIKCARLMPINIMEKLTKKQKLRAIKRYVNTSDMTEYIEMDLEIRLIMFELNEYTNDMYYNANTIYIVIEYNHKGEIINIIPYKSKYGLKNEITKEEFKKRVEIYKKNNN